MPNNNQLLCPSLSAAWRNRRMVKLKLNIDEDYWRGNWNSLAQTIEGKLNYVSASLTNQAKFKATFGKMVY